MNESDRPHQYPHCRKRFSVVTVKLGVLKCNKCGKEFPDPRK